MKNPTLVTEAGEVINELLPGISTILGGEEWSYLKMSQNEYNLSSHRSRLKPVPD